MQRKLLRVEQTPTITSRQKSRQAFHTSLALVFSRHAISTKILTETPFVSSIQKGRTIDLFTDTAAILNSIVLTEKLWAAEGAIAGKFIVYTAFRINFYCLSLIFHNKYYKRYIFPSRYLAVVPMVIEKLLLKVITPQYSF